MKYMVLPNGDGYYSIIIPEGDTHLVALLTQSQYASLTKGEKVQLLCNRVASTSKAQIIKEDIHVEAN